LQASGRPTAPAWGRVDTSYAVGIRIAPDRLIGLLLDLNGKVVELATAATQGQLGPVLHRELAGTDVDAVVADVAALIRSTGHARAHVVGHDWGGIVGWYLSMYHARRIDKLVVINAPHPVAYQREVRRSDQLARSWYAFFFQLPLLPEAAVRLTIRRGLRESAAIPGAFPDEALDIYQNGVSRPGAATAMLNYYRAAFREALKLTAQSRRVINLPTLLIWGVKDLALSPRLTEGLQPLVPNIRVERVNDSAHWVPEEKPRLVGDLLMDFLW
jgi:pimeloyl-ACP methyl ester carboxylesterase